MTARGRGLFSYYLELALRSFRRSPGLTALMVLAIGFGVAASMTTFSVFRAVSGDPIPWKSHRLFVPQVDVWGPSERGKDGEPPAALDYRTATALLNDRRGSMQAAIYKVSPAVLAMRAGSHPVNVDGHAVSSDFFPMLEVPFAFGSGWSRQDDERRANVVVIGDTLNRRLFQGRNSVGETLQVAGKSYRIVGVLAHWDPQPRFFDIVNTGGFTTTREDVFLPFETAVGAGIASTGNTGCSKSPSEGGIAGLKESTCVWISYLVQLDDADAVRAYRAYLDGYARQLQDSGATTWAPNNRLRDIPAWLDAQHVVPADTGVSLLVALGLLIVCLVNTSGLLLAKFLRRSGEIGVRRAIGAPRGAIYAQFLTEAGMIGIAGGLLGLALTGLGVACVHWLLPADIASLARVDLVLLLLTLLLALVSTLLAGLYPTFRATLVQPTWQLKSQ